MADTTPEPTDPTELRRALFQPESLVDHFRIMRLLGRGGMGEVFLARDTKLGRKVALKVIHPEQIGSAAAVESFLFEARAMARFSHPNIVTIYAVGELRGCPYVALEYLEGQTLRERMREDRPGVREAIRFGLAIADAIAEAHANGILHRDLKPENALIPKDGRLRVVDFGLAKIIPGREISQPEAARPEPEADEDTEVRGTPAYMAPERWMEREATEAADIWSLGVILYELVSGKGPYAGTTLAELALRICSSDPVPRIRTVNEVPAELLELTYRCLEKTPEQRPSAREVVEALEGMLASHRRRYPEQDVPCPFRGLLPFSERHADFFFGREAETAAFLERLRDQPVLPVVGPSGAGKSSFVQAGVIPRLREQGPWMVLQFRPGNAPFRALASRLLYGESATRTHDTVSNMPTVDIQRPLPEEEGADDDRAEGEARLGEQILGSPSLVNLMLQQIAKDGGCRVLLFVDQLEEIYTLVEDDDLRRRFMRAICSAADDPQDPVRVVFTLRDDFLVRLAEGPEAREALSHVTVLRSPEPPSLEQTLVRPLEGLGYGFDDPDLPAEMVSAVRDEPAALPLLQFVTRLLWEQRDTKRRRLLRAAYQAAGGVDGALAKHADGVLEGLPVAQVNLARELLLRLVTAEGTRRVLSRERALEGLGEPAREVLGRLTLARLITVKRAHGDPAAHAELELAHESLVRTWGRLARWIEESHEDLAFLAEITQAAELWARRGERDAEVWQGDALHEARRHLERCTTAVPERVRRFLAAGNRKEQRLIRLKRLRIAAGFGLLAAIAVGALLVAWALSRKEQQARFRLAEAQREGARAALARGDLLEARAKLRSSLETQDSPLARALWWRVVREPLVWSKPLGSFVYDVAFSPDGKVVAAACHDKSIYLIGIGSTSVQILRGHGDQVFALAYSPDGRHLASGTWSGEVRVWDLASGGHRGLPGHKAAVWGLAFSPDGKHLASSSYDRTIKIWDLERDSGGRPLELAGHTDRIRGVAWSPDGQLLASAGYDKTVRIWDIRSSRALRVLRGHTDRVYSAIFTRDGKRVLSSSLDGTIRVWELSEAGTHRVLIRQRESIFGLSLSPDGKRLAFGSYDHKAHVWNLARGVEEWTLQGHVDHVHGVAFSPDGRRLVSGSVDRTVRLWNLSVAAGPPSETGHTAAVFGLSFSPDGQRLASGSYDKSVRLWDVATGAELAALEGHTGVVYNVAFHPDGKQLASCSLDKTIRLWDLQTGAEQRILAGHESGITDVAFTPDGRRLASAGWDKTVRIWDPGSGAQQRVLRGHTDRIIVLAISPDGRRLASGSTDKTIRIWDLESGAERMVLTGHTDGIYGMDFSPDGRRLVSGSTDKTIRIWDLATRTSRVLGTVPSRIYWLAYHPDGKRIGAPLSDGTARIYDLEAGTYRLLRGHRSEVNFCTFTRDGKLLATSSDDGTVRLWDVEQAQPFWRAPVLLASPPQTYTHQGWAWLEGTAPERWPPRQGWRRALEDAADASASDRLLCLRTRGSGGLELWNLAQDRRLLTARVAGLREVLALPDGCATLDDAGRAVVHRRDGKARLLSSGVSALAYDRGEILAATAKEVLVFGLSGDRRGSHTADIGVRTMLRTGEWLVLGFDEGNIELVPLSPKRSKPTYSFERVPSSPVVRLLAGPMGTLIAGYANGTLGIWSLRNGAQLHHTRLHGPVVHMVLRRGTLFAVTELGQADKLDLEVFHADYCHVMRRVWAAVPTVWEGGLPVLRTPPRGHRCLRGS